MRWKMKAIMGLIKFILKILAVIAALVVFFAGIVLAMFYFSNPKYYTSFIEKTFVEGTGQKIKIMGDVELKPGKKLETTFNHSIITLKAHIGDVKVMTRNLYLAIPWNALFSRQFEKAPMRADQVIVELVKDEKVISTYSASSVSVKIERTCCNLEFKDLKMAMKQGDLEGNITIVPSEQSLKVIGNLHAKSWKIDTPIDPKKKTVAFEGVKDLTGSIIFTIDTLHTPQGEMHNVEGVIDLGAERLTIQSSHVILSSSYSIKNLVK